MTPSLELQPFSQATPERMQYWGGFFDAALFLDIQPRIYKHPHSSDPTLEDNLIYSPYIAIKNSDKAILESLSILLPGNIHPTTTRTRDIEYKGWQLRLIRQVNAFMFITRLKPYLDYKQTQVEAMEEFLRQKREVRRELEGLDRVPKLYQSNEDRIAVEEEFRQRLLQIKGQTFDETHLPEPARLAGIIDADASFGIYSTNRHRGNGLSIEFQVHADFFSVHKGLLEELHQAYGGTKPTEEGNGVGRYAGPSWEWQVGGAGLADLLKTVEPHLIFKQTQARLIIDFLKIKSTLTRTSTDSFVNAQRTAVLQSYVDAWRELVAA